MSDSLNQSSNRASGRRVHAQNVNELLRVWHQDLNENEQKVALETARRRSLKNTGQALGSTAGSGNYGRVRNAIATKIRRRCPDLTGASAVTIASMVHAVFPSSTDDAPRCPDDD